jgi:predicted ATP-dependent serine protease
MDRTYICQDCGHKADARTFGLLVRCPECGSDGIADAEVLERFGPGKPKDDSSEEGDSK